MSEIRGFVLPFLRPRGRFFYALDRDVAFPGRVYDAQVAPVAVS